MSGDTDRRTVISVAVALVVLVAIVLGGIALAGGGDNGEGTTTSPAPAAAPSEGATPPSGGGLQLPPGIAECLADQGFDVDPSDLHSVPPQVLNRCFEALHQGGGVP